MKIDLAKYKDKRICVAVSGGKDSMALLHYLYTHAGDYGITLSALNCDHKIRGEASARDSEFVRNWCASKKIPLMFSGWDEPLPKTEANARAWRLFCYSMAIKPDSEWQKYGFIAAAFSDSGKWSGADAIATAHHMNDNAETVLFNLARGSSLSGMKGITDADRIIRPLISCSRAEIDEYIRKNKIPHVEDESNFTDCYTRNKIRHNVLPELEKAVPDAAKAIYRFSRLAAEDEQYFENLIEQRKLINRTLIGFEIHFCEEKVVFRRAAVKAIKEIFNRKDYTSEHLERLYELQYSEKNKKFEFLNITAFKEDGKIALCDKTLLFEAENGALFCDYESEESYYMGQYIAICEECDIENFREEAPPRIAIKTHKFDFDKIPPTAVIRFMRTGDRFTKFGGGTKNLGDYFTDKKIPVRVRKQIPLIADGSEILAVGGVEISDKIKINDETKVVSYIMAKDYIKE